MSMKTKKYRDFFVWTDDEVELLLKVTKDFKEIKGAEDSDWEACQSKYSEIFERFRERYPAPEEAMALGKDYRHKKEEINRGHITTKLKAIRFRYRQAVDSGRRNGHGRVILLFFDLCTSIWGRSPATLVLPAGIETIDVKPEVSTLELTDPVLSISSVKVKVEEVSVSAEMENQHQRVHVPHTDYKGEKQKKKIPFDSVAQEDLEIKRRLLQQLETSDHEFGQTMGRWSSTMDRLTSNIEMLMQHIMGSGNNGCIPSLSPHTSHQNQSTYAHSPTRRPLGEFNPPAHSQHSTSPSLEKSLKKQQEQKKMQEQQRNAELAQQNEDLKRTQENLLRKLQQTGPSSPSTPTTSRAACTARSSVDSTPITRSASSPSDMMPIITKVTSLSRITRRKRSPGEQSEGKALKKSRLLNEYCNNAPESPSTSAFISDLLTSQMEIPDNNVSTDKEEEESNTDDDDDDIVIDETKSTPRPKAFNLAKVKLERSTSNDVQYSDDVSMDTPTTEGSRNATTNPSTSNVSMTTQTECNMIVKEEDDQQRKIEKGEIKEKETDSDATGIECRKDKGTEINRSISEDSRCRSVDIERKPSLAEGNDRGGTSHMPEEPAMDFGLNIYNMPTLEAQKQQDSLLELMDATAKEREEYKMQAQSLALKLQDKECELLKLTVKKEFSHQNIQTDPLEEKDYKTLYLEATRRNEQLSKTINEMKKKQEEMLLQMKAEKEAQDKMKAEGAGHSATPNVDDEMALQVDFLLRELDQRNTECGELKIKVESLEQVKARCEQLQRDLDHLRKEKVECRSGPEQNGTDIASSTQTAHHKTEDGSGNRANQIIENRETNENPAGGENTVTNAKLRQLRSSVARLLVTFVPALDPEQVNYDCEVIDEILNQVIQEISPTVTTST
ncbi:uncharacterized protein [Paramisgurnus dabryanus]|uniref:uncharacterized protein isoform X3 n=1 Tax=Paramisgurnus dabryanus TaxID=90735 RepID=UPI0031F3D6D6